MIPIQNIYYMLAYAFKVLNQQGYKDLATEQFNNSAELCSAILSKGISIQLKRGLYRDYIMETDCLSIIRGKIDVSETIKSGSLYKNQMFCRYDNFSTNSYMNRIIKTTIELLLHSDISKTRKKELSKLLVFFADVESLDVNRINWNLQYNRNNQTYRMLISICFLVIKGLLLSNSNGKTKMLDIFDEQRMYRLYEKFIFEFFRKEFPDITVNSSQIHWQLDDGINTMLPVMQTDIMLSKDDKILIIDAKYYNRITLSRFGINTLHSGNLYQIFTYVKNKEYQMKDRPHEVSGMLLYAKTDDDILPDITYKMSGNKISVCTLDLNCDFNKIASQLNAIIEEYFG